MPVFLISSYPKCIKIAILYQCKFLQFYRFLKYVNVRDQLGQKKKRRRNEPRNMKKEQTSRDNARKFVKG